MSADLVEVQRGVVAQSADGGQLNQPVELSALHQRAIFRPDEEKLECLVFSLVPELKSRCGGGVTYTSPSGVYFEPEMSN